VAHWSIPFDKLAKKLNNDIEVVIRASILKVFSDVVIRSPVDTGRFRANWNFSYNVIDAKISDSVDVTGEGKLAEIQAALLKFKLGDVAYLANSLPYAMVLEYGLYPDPVLRGSFVKGEGMVIKSAGGYSKQAPHGMVRVAAREFAQDVNEVIAGRR
jgi:hypothetical protein